MPVTDILRRRLGKAVIDRVAGPRDGASGERPRTAEADRWFAADRPIRQVHEDCAMFVGGIAALLGMLNSCASNVTVVNIDNGFGAGYVASLINRL